MKMLHGIKVWDRSCDLAIKTYFTLGACADPVFREQTTRSSLCLATHIAEGCALESPQQFCEYLQLARGCCAELRTQLYLAGVMGIIDEAQSNTLIEDSLELANLIDGLISSYQYRPD